MGDNHSLRQSHYQSVMTFPWLLNIKLEIVAISDTSLLPRSMMIWKREEMMMLVMEEMIKLMSMYIFDCILYVYKVPVFQQDLLTKCTNVLSFRNNKIQYQDRLNKIKKFHSVIFVYSIHRVQFHVNF